MAWRCRFLAAPATLVDFHTGDDAGHRALADDEALARAFLGAGYATFDRCCDWAAPDAARTAVVRPDIDPKQSELAGSGPMPSPRTARPIG